MTNSMPTIIQSIHPDRIESVMQAMRGTFGALVPDEFSLLAGGYSSSQVYKIKIKNQHFVIRVMGLDQELPDREKQIMCLQLAAAADLAPACRYADAGVGVVIMDYVQPVQYEATQMWLIDMAYNLRKLHGLTTFPIHHLISVFSYMDGLMQGIKVYPMSDLLNNYLKKIADVKTNLFHYLAKQATHNDLNPNNVLFNGKKIYFIDWEAAGLDDPFIDLATICNYFIFEPPLQKHFLEHYFGASPTSEQLEKLHWMRQIAYAYCSLHFLGFAAEAGLPLLDENMSLIPDAFAWNEGYREGKYSLKNPADFLLYGMVQVKMSLKQMG